MNIKEPPKGGSFKLKEAHTMTSAETASHTTTKERVGLLNDAIELSRLNPPLIGNDDRPLRSPMEIYSVLVSHIASIAMRDTTPDIM
jgi:hypothetical protein